MPKMKEDMDPQKIKLALEGCAPVASMPPPPAVERRKGRESPPVPVKTEVVGDVELPPRLFASLGEQKLCQLSMLLASYLFIIQFVC